MIIIAGGSGGHVFPGLTIANFLIKNGWKIHWIGTKNNIESKIVPKYGIKIHFIKIKGLRDTNLKNLFFAPIYIFNAFYQIQKIIKNWSPDIILGMGGYVSGPGGIAAWYSRIPFILHEQNKIAGITNKYLSKISTKNMQAFSGALKNAEIVGNPISENIINIPSPQNRFKNRKGPLRVLVIGGSQGAAILNNIVPEALFLLKNKIIIWHQSGIHGLTKTQVKYKKLGIQCHIITAFITNIASAYEWADLIISRSGALTVSEVSVVGLGAIFIPYPHKDRQQYKNAQDLISIGSAKIIDQIDFNADFLANILRTLDRQTLLVMAEKAYSLGVRNSTLKIFNVINKTINTK